MLFQDEGTRWGWHQSTEKIAAQHSAHPPREWPAWFSIWQVRRLNLSLGILPSHWWPQRTLPWPSLPSPLKQFSPYLPVYIWPLPSLSVPYQAISYLCVPDKVSGHALPPCFKHHIGTHKLQTLHSSFLASQTLRKMPPPSWCPSFNQLPWKLPRSSSGHTRRLLSDYLQDLPFFVWTLKINIWWSQTWTASLLRSPDFYCSHF